MLLYYHYPVLSSLVISKQIVRTYAPSFITKQHVVFRFEAIKSPAYYDKNGRRNQNNIIKRVPFVLKRFNIQGGEKKKGEKKTNKQLHVETTE